MRSDIGRDLWRHSLGGDVMTTEAYRADLASGLSPEEAEDAENEREAFAQIERDSRPAPLLPLKELTNE